MKNEYKVYVEGKILDNVVMSTSGEVYYIDENKIRIVDKKYELCKSTKLNDKDGNELFEGDYYISTVSYIDGYLKKKYPRRINVVCQIKFNCGEFYPVVLGAVKEHREAYENNNYRSIGYSLVPTHKGCFKYNEKTKEFDIDGDNETCDNILKIGNKYENDNVLNKYM